MDLSKFTGKCDEKPLFDDFWKSALDAYKGIDPSYGTRKNASKAFNKYARLHAPDRVKELTRRLILIVDIYKSKQADGVFSCLPHVSTWINSEEWAEPEQSYKSKPKKKDPLERPMIPAIVNKKAKTYTPEERAAMQQAAGFNIRGANRG